jgi:hypothetical protein
MHCIVLSSVLNNHLGTIVNYVLKKRVCIVGKVLAQVRHSRIKCVDEIVKNFYIAKNDSKWFDS